MTVEEVAHVAERIALNVEARQILRAHNLDGRLDSVIEHLEEQCTTEQLALAIWTPEEETTNASA